MINDIQNNEEPKENIKEDDAIIISFNISEEDYILNISISKDKNCINFKLENKNILTYYYFEKYNIRELRLRKNFFLSDYTISDLFSHLKEIISKCNITLEKRGFKMYICFKNPNQSESKNLLFFPLKKMIVSQNNLNPVLIDKNQENIKTIKILKAQIEKINKEVESKTKLIEELNNNIIKINNFLNKLSKIEEENKSVSNIDDEEELSRDSSPNFEDSEEKKCINDIRNNLKSKRLKYIQIEKTNNENDNLFNEDDNKFFCLENVQVLGNKKLFEILVIFNIVSILIIMCLLGSIYTIKSDLEYEKTIEDEFLNKFSYLNYINGYEEDLKNNKIKGDKIKFVRIQENKKIEGSLLENELTKYNFKIKIQSFEGNNRDFDFIIKYNSYKDKKSYEEFYKKCKDIKNGLILMKNDENKKFAIYSKKIQKLINIGNPQNYADIKDEVVGFSYDSEDIYELKLKYFMEIYTKFLQKIVGYFSNDNLNPFNKNNNFWKKIWESTYSDWNVTHIQIYQIKYK